LTAYVAVNAGRAAEIGRQPALTGAAASRVFAIAVRTVPLLVAGEPARPASRARTLRMRVGAYEAAGRVGAVALDFTLLAELRRRLR